MTEAEQIIHRIEAMGGSLTLRGDRIAYRIPKDATEILTELRKHKAEVLSVLSQHRSAGEPGGSSVSELPPCGSPHCAGCYDVGEGRKIHPPKCGQDYLNWLRKWEGKGKLQ